MKLEKFKTESPKKKAMIIGSILLVLLITIVVVYRSFAFFEENQEFNVIKGSVPDQNYDLMLSFQIEENGSRRISDTIPEGKDYIIDIKCNNGSTGEWDYEIWAPKINNLTNTRTKCTILFQKATGLTDGKVVYNFDYTGDFQEFIVPYTGSYKLEVWGAQGGSYSSYHGGYGGYSTGEIQLEKNTILYLGVGGAGSATTGGYNGGGERILGNKNNMYGGSGGGATHIAFQSGVLSSLEDNKDSILLVAGGGGGATYFVSNPEYIRRYHGGSGGGYIGVSDPSGASTGGTQTSGGVDGKKTITSGFGFGAVCPNEGCGGGGYYGGGAGTDPKYPYAGSGGSGYIGNEKLMNQVMFCYQCITSDEQLTKTISTENVSDEPISNYAKSGNGYARITYIVY